MAPRVLLRAFCGPARPPWVPWVPTAPRRLYSSSVPSDQTRFSYFLPAHEEGAHEHLLAKLKDSEVVANPHCHDAALILATPNFTKQLGSSGFVRELAKLLSASANVGQFHVLCAIVDHVAPALGEPGSMHNHGISVLRGRLDDTLPGLWLPSPPKAKEDADAVSALTFELGSPRVTLPLARTTFQNSRTSTLLASRFDMTRRDSPELAHQGEKHSQRVKISLNHPPKAPHDMGLWAPLSPMTRARVVTESFGNIVRGVQVDGETQPASTELEAAVNAIFEHRSASAATATPGPMGVWAMVVPDPDPEGAPSPTAVLQGKPVTRDTVEATAQYLAEAYRSGGRLYKILSGGGGWGAKKGLLSMDPQRTHFALSEEEEMARFMQTMENSGFAPPGSQMQFFIPAQAPAQLMAPTPSAVVFGVPGDAEGAEGAEELDAGFLVGDHFGALSSRGIFVAGPPDPETGGVDESKLSVPNSRIFAGTGTGTGGGPTGGLLGFLGAGALADAGTIALA